MKIWKIALLLFLTFSMITVTGSVYRAVLNRDKKSSDVSSILPYYSMKLNLDIDKKSKAIDVTYLDDLNLNLDVLKEPLGNDKKFELEFSSDSKFILLKIYSLDQDFNRNFNKIYLIDSTARQILKEFSDLNTDYFFDGGNGVISVRKTFFNNKKLNNGFELMQGDRTVWKYENPPSDNGSIWQISDIPIYLSGKNLVIAHLFDPLNSSGGHLTKVFDLNQEKEILSFETKPFATLRSDLARDFVYTEDESRFDTDFFNLNTGKQFNINNKNFILASNIADIDKTYKFLSNSLQEYDNSSRGKYMDISKPAQVIKIWDMENRSLIDTFEVSDQPLTSILVTKDATMILVGTVGESIEFMDVKTKAKVLNLMPNDDKQRVEVKNRPKFKIQLSPNQKTLVAIGFDAKVHFWQLRF